MTDAERLDKLEREHQEGRGLTAGEVQWLIELARRGLVDITFQCPDCGKVQRGR